MSRLQTRCGKQVRIRSAPIVANAPRAQKEQERKQQQGRQASSGHGQRAGESRRWLCDGCAPICLHSSKWVWVQSL